MEEKEKEEIEVIKENLEKWGQKRERRGRQETGGNQDLKVNQEFRGRKEKKEDRGESG